MGFSFFPGGNYVLPAFAKINREKYSIDFKIIEKLLKNRFGNRVGRGLYPRPPDEKGYQEPRKKSRESVFLSPVISISCLPLMGGKSTHSIDNTIQ